MELVNWDQVLASSSPLTYLVSLGLVYFLGMRRTNLILIPCRPVWWLGLLASVTLALSGCSLCSSRNIQQIWPMIWCVDSSNLSWPVERWLIYCTLNFCSLAECGGADVEIALGFIALRDFWRTPVSRKPYDGSPISDIRRCQRNSFPLICFMRTLKTFFNLNWWIRSWCRSFGKTRIFFIPMQASQTLDEFPPRTQHHRAQAPRWAPTVVELSWQMS